MTTRKADKSAEERKKIFEKTNDWHLPRSICTCGHTGDGEHSEHHTIFAHGHGRCKVAGCPCKQFTWKNFLPEFVKYMGWKE